MDDRIEKAFRRQMGSLGQEQHANGGIRIDCHTGIEPLTSDINQLRKQPGPRNVVVYREFASHECPGNLVCDLLSPGMLHAFERLLLRLPDDATCFRPGGDGRLSEMQLRRLIEAGEEGLVWNFNAV